MNNQKAIGSAIGANEPNQLTRTSPLMSTLSALHAELELLHSKIARLGNRLEPVMGASSPTNGNNTQGVTPLCEAISSVYEANQKISTLQSIVDDIFDRVQV